MTWWNLAPCRCCKGQISLEVRSNSKFNDWRSHGTYSLGWWAPCKMCDDESDLSVGCLEARWTWALSFCWIFWWLTKCITSQDLQKLTCTNVNRVFHVCPDCNDCPVSVYSISLVCTVGGISLDSKLPNVPRNEMPENMQSHDYVLIVCCSNRMLNKHCQRHKGLEGWTHITNSYTNLTMFLLDPSLIIAMQCMQCLALSQLTDWLTHRLIDWWLDWCFTIGTLGSYFDYWALQSRIRFFSWHRTHKSIFIIYSRI